MHRVVLHVGPLGKKISPARRLLRQHPDRHLNAQDVKAMARLPEVANRTLTPCVARIDLDNLTTYNAEGWGRVTSLVCIFLEELRYVLKPNTRRPVIRITCSEQDFAQSRARALVKDIRDKCDDTAISWVRTGSCRYQGATGDIVVRWKERTAVEPSTSDDTRM